MQVIPNFIVFEGCDGSGTTTQLETLTKRMAAEYHEKIRFFSTCEPTGGLIGETIRNAMSKTNDFKVKPQTLALLFAANRYEHLYGTDGIIERTGKGELVASDRYVLSSLAYQGIDCGDELPLTLNESFPFPEITIFLDVKPSVAFPRITQNRASLEIFEKLDFQEKVYKKYITMIETYKRNGARVEIIDGSKSTEEVAESVWSVISKMPIFKAQ
ncbi:MAG: dTMP kinase [Treponema sp.]|nr:dTMP kinase [Treponema sp.]